MRFAAALALASLLLAGCSGLKLADDHAVSATPILEGDEGWNRDGRFRVVVEPATNIRIEATEAGGDVKVVEGLGDVTIELPDGTWEIVYRVDGKVRDRLHDVRIDATPPSVEGLEFVGEANEAGVYRLGDGFPLEADATVRVTDAAGQLVAQDLPADVSGLDDGVHAFTVQITDPAGNVVNQTVHVRAGEARDLPEGKYTFGIVARYTAEARLWDLADPAAYASRDEAADEAAEYLGEGWGVTPDADVIQDIVADEVTPSMNTMEAALALFSWFADHVEYDESQLAEGDSASGNLLTPEQVIMDSEAEPRRDRDEDGFADDGNGNDVAGGVCRDLAAAYVSLLRGAGVPARLVSGYLDGTVDGFHAWVEFYAGAVGGQGPWVTVDVSLVDDQVSPAMIVQAFGIERPDYLALRVVPAPEAEEWSTAVSVASSWPSDKDPPQVSLEKDVDVDSEESGVLCFDPGTLARRFAEAPSACPAGLNHYLEDIVLRSQRTIDYGVDVDEAPRGAEVTVRLGQPFESAAAPDDVLHSVYGGQRVTTQAQTGTVSTTLKY